MTRIIKSHYVIGTFEKCVEAAGYNADKLIKLLFNEFEAYRDEAVFEGSKGNYC